MHYLQIWEKFQNNKLKIRLAGLIFSTVTAQLSHTTSKCRIAYLRSLAEAAYVNPALVSCLWGDPLQMSKQV
jgi:hypothetical protein